METVTTISLAGLTLAATLCVARLVRPGSVADRIVALDTLIVVIVGGIAVQAARTGSGTFLWVLIVTSLLGFVATVSVARFIERRGAR